MKAVVRATFFYLLFAALPSVSFAQKVNWNIVRTDGDTLTDCKFTNITGDTLQISRNETIQFIPVDSIKILYRYRDLKKGKGSIVGILLGGVVGGVIGGSTKNIEPKKNSSNGSDFIDISGYDPINEKKVNTVVGVIVGMVLGFTVEEIITWKPKIDESLDFTIRTRDWKVQILKNIILQNQNDYLVKFKISPP